MKQTRLLALTTAFAAACAFSSGEANYPMNDVNRMLADECARRGMKIYVAKLKRLEKRYEYQSRTKEVVKEGPL